MQKLKRTRVTWWFKPLLLLLLLQALYVSLWREGLGMLPNLEHTLVQQLEKQLNAEVSLNGVTGQLFQFQPHIHIVSATIRTSTGEQARVRDVRLKVSFLESVWTRRLIFTDIWVQELAFNKPWQMIKQAPAFDAFNEAWLAFALAQHRIHVQRMDFDIDSITVQLHEFSTFPLFEFDYEQGLQTQFQWRGPGYKSQGLLQLQVADPLAPLSGGRMAMTLYADVVAPLFESSSLFPRLHLRWENDRIDFAFHDIEFRRDQLQIGPVAGVGQMQLSPEQVAGHVALKPGPVELSWPEVFSRPVKANLATGNRIDFIHDDYWRIFSSDFELTGDVHVDSQWRLHLGTTPYLSLLGEVRAENVEQYMDYIPVFLPVSLKQWLYQAGFKGQLDAGRFLFDGPLKRAVPGYFDGFAGPDRLPDEYQVPAVAIQSTPQPTLQMAFESKNIELGFASQWPRVSVGDADVFVGHRELTFQAHHLESEGLDGRVLGNVSFFKTPELELQVEAAGDLSHALEYMQQTPLEKNLDWVALWDMTQGSVTTNLELSLPLSHRHLEPKVTGRVQVNDVSVRLVPTQLQATHINGAIDFNVPGAWRTVEPLSVNVLGSVASVWLRPQEQQHIIQWQVRLGGEQLARWLRWPIFKHIYGETDFLGSLEFGTSTSPTLRLSTDLQGLEVFAPSPIGKKSTEQHPWALIGVFDERPRIDLHSTGRYRVLSNLSDQEDLVDVFIGDMTETQAAIPEDHQITGFVKAVLPVADGLEWQHWFQSFGTNATSVRSQRLNISIDAFSIGDVELGRLQVSAGLEPHGWRFQWDGQSMTGHGFMPRHGDNPWRLTFEQLRLPSFNGSYHEQAQSFNLSQWPALDLRLNSVWNDSGYLGRAEVRGQWLDDQYQWTELYAQLADIHLRGSGAMSQGLDAHFSVEFRGPGVDRLFEIWPSLHMPVSAARMSGAFDLGWNGQFSRDSLKASGNILLEDGRIIGASPVRWLGLLSAERFARRLKFDFSEFQEGILFDQIQASLDLEGLIVRNRSFVLHSPSLELGAKGWVDFESNTLFQECVALVPVLDHLLLPAAAAGGLPAAATAFVLDKAFGGQLDSLTTLHWQLKGMLDNPEVLD